MYNERKQFYDDYNEVNLNSQIGNYLVDYGNMSYQTVCREIVRGRLNVKNDIIELENKLVCFCVENKSKDVLCLLKLVNTTCKMDNISQQAFSTAFSTMAYNFDVSLDSIFCDYFKDRTAKKKEIRETLVNCSILKYGIDGLCKKEQHKLGIEAKGSDWNIIAIISIILNVMLLFLFIYTSGSR